ncbi:DUF3006 domain-containing protein [Acutalibacter sp. JLR.KK004]|jgi:hypothetical protein|uniref:DUF3006 domain-containing protein n=1 Tax=Acutalibacter sp. JLR.KK004 TaxID=3112622 RepID=UPI00216B71F8|nr:DUF3006 domain-containing protein [Acutalibacter sp.]
MKQLIIDRYEGKYAICEEGEQKYFAIELSELPEGAKPGCVLEITDNGELSLNLEETQRRRQRILEKQRRAFGG